MGRDEQNGRLAAAATFNVCGSREGGGAKKKIVEIVAVVVATVVNGGGVRVAA